MSGVLVQFGGIGGLIAALAAIIVAGRAIFRQINATEDNTEALKALTAEVREQRTVISGHETRLAVLEDQRRRP